MNKNLKQNDKCSLGAIITFLEQSERLPEELAPHLTLETWVGIEQMKKGRKACQVEEVI